LIKMILILLTMAATLFAGTPDSSDILPEGPFLRSIRLSHYPPDVLIINRPYHLDLFVGFPEDSVENVSIFIKQKPSEFFQEIHLDHEFNRYRYTLGPESKQGKTITYFFLVTLHGYSLYIVPAPEGGEASIPVERTYLSPLEYFRQKRTKR